MKCLSQETWCFMALAAVSAVVLFTGVNLVPRVDNNFFFSNSDPQFKDEKQISGSFTRKDNLLIINARGDIESREYTQKARDLSNALTGLKGIAAIKSISHGPADIKDALEGPLWNRLLIADDRKSSNIVVFLEPSFPPGLMREIEKLLPAYSSRDFHLIMSGPPYIVELVSRYLLKDIRVFTLLILAVFGIVMLLIFRSGVILLGSVVSCLSASIWSLMVVQLMGNKIGMMTANLATIVFVLTLSHIIFLTYNWKYVCARQDPVSPVREAVGLTFVPSFWSMVTALLGF